MTSTHPKFFCYFGHHKAGTKWISSMIDELCFFMGLRHSRFDTSYALYSELQNRSIDKTTDFISYANAASDLIDKLPPFRGFHVIRDPRDVCISAYFSHLNSHSTDGWPELEEHRKTLQKCSLHDGIIHDMDFTASLPLRGKNLNYFTELKNWNYSQPNIIEIKFEDLVSRPYEVFPDIFRFIGVLSEEPMSASQAARIAMHSGIRHIAKNSNLFRMHILPPDIIFRIIWNHNFYRQSGGRIKGQENVKSHYRKGVPGDWVNYFTEDVKSAFKTKFGNLVAHLGYETDNDW